MDQNVEESVTDNAIKPTTLKTPDQQHTQSRKRLVFADPAAFRYLEEDPSTAVLERRRRLQGYELYYVEQWICSRVHPTFIIATYTGFEQHSVMVGVLSVPVDETQWSSRLRVYFKALKQFHAREKDTPLGTLMITNLSSFPSALTVILVPDGDARAHREDFFINEDLKRMGCAGRAGMNLAPPVAATQAKFMQLYHTSERVPLRNAVLELVKLCQVALVLFGKIAPEYCDGLLCDVTERAVNDWWNDIGGLFFNTDPSDGILGPTTVAGILGVLMGARNRLHTLGAPVAKDVFDLVATKRGIAYFQKHHKLEKTRRLDHRTLEKLHRASARIANGEGWTVHRAVKSTVAELSGRGGEMVRDMVGREKIGIADIETLDIETFVTLLTGERSRWLWHGKPRKDLQNDAYNNISNDQEKHFAQTDEGDFLWTSPKRDSVVNDQRLFGLPTRISSHPMRGSQSELESLDTKESGRRKMLGRVTGRVKGVVAFRGHQQKSSMDDNKTLDNDSLQLGSNRNSFDRDSEAVTPTSSTFGPGSFKSSSHSRRASAIPEQVRIQRKRFQDLKLGKNVKIDSDDLGSSDGDGTRSASNKGFSGAVSEDEASNSPKLDGPFSPLKGHMSATSHRFNRRSDAPLSLQRRSSTSDINTNEFKEDHIHRLPRHLSFEVACKALTYANTPPDVEIGEFLQDEHIALNTGDAIDSGNQIQQPRLAISEARSLASHLTHLQTHSLPHLQSLVKDLSALEHQSSEQQESVDALYAQCLSSHNDLHNASNDLIDNEKSHLLDALKEMDTLGAKLDYEIKGLESKVEDMENGLSEMERLVRGLEGRVREVVVDEEGGGGGEVESWFWWGIVSALQWVKGPRG